MILALLLDLANIAGGFLLAVALLRRLPRVGPGLGRFAERMGPFGWIVGIFALALGVMFVLIHLLRGSGIYIFELVGIAVGLALLWDRLTGRPSPVPQPNADGTTGVALMLAIFGVIAILVGLDGLITPD
ncbi:hypothetical protein ACQP00_39505 [Dactylosporangium sp. CS-047395]|uniref:hypothetical protein n=1 Tax=Dactylosporangium sp. CS-047395 TaxID=3239936 RepID=UPI003D8DD8F4